MARKLIVEVVGDTKSLERAFDKSTVASKRFAGQMQTTGATVDRGVSRVSSLSKLFAGGLAAGVAVRGVSSLTTAASDLNEEISKSNVVFGKSAGEIDRWSQSTAKALGVSRTEALRAASTFGSIFSNTGQSVTQAARLSKVLVTLGADLASFNNTPIADALNALRSGLSGEIEPLRRFQVFLTEAAVAQRALADSGKASKDELTQGEKILARYNLILEQTKKQQGDAVRTAGEFAGQQKRLRAQLADTRAELGERLLPTMVKLAEGANALVASFHGVEVAASNLASADFRQKFADVFGIEELRRVLGEVAPQLKEAQDQFVRDIQGVFAEPLKVEVNVEPTVTGPTGPKGFGFGLKPSDILGPLIKSVPKGLEEELLDAEIFGDPKRIRDVLIKQEQALREAIEDPRLKRKGRIEVKQALEGVVSGRRSIESQIEAAVKADAAERKAAGERATAAAQKAAAETKERLRKLKEDRERLAEQARDALQARQFRAIGLSATGDQPIPGVENLRKQLASLADRTDLPDKFRAQFSGIAKVLRGDFGKITEETRRAINEFFQTVRSTFDQETKQTSKFLTKTRALDTSEIVKGLGLSGDVANEIRGRLSKFNTAGLALGGAPRARGAVPTSSAGGTVITGPITVISNDPDDMVRKIQKKAGRSSASTRGRFGGINLGLS